GLNLYEPLFFTVSALFLAIFSQFCTTYADNGEICLTCTDTQKIHKFFSNHRKHLVVVNPLKNKNPPRAENTLGGCDISCCASFW
ncbi:MAG: hypothetical protein IIV43_02705, partial [Oscillospiraceae bacterium]|nr:hypothetical protein [Oscillospiraceae bacterium]